jgi:hypothetical protein
MQNTAAEAERLKGVTISEDYFAKLPFVIMRPVFAAPSRGLGENTPQ